MPDYGDITGGLPPVPLDFGPPDLSSLAWPWDTPAEQPLTAPDLAGVAAGPPPAAPDAPVIAGAPAEVPPDLAAATPVVAAEPPAQPLGIADQGAAPPLPQVAPGAPAIAAQPPQAAPPAAADLQPGLGIPAAALDAAIPPGPVIGPPTEAQAALGAPASLAPAAGPAAPPALPYGALPAAPPPVGGPGLPPGTAGPPAPTVADLADVTIEPPLTNDQELAQRYAGHVLDIPDEQAKRAAWLALTPEERTAQESIWLATRDQHMAARRLDASARSLQEARDNLAALQRADAATKIQMDETSADVQRIVNTKIDPTGGLTTGGKIAGVLAAVVGGLVQGRTGAARNAGLDMLDQTINRGIEAQKATLQNQLQGALFRRGTLAAEYARHGDLYRAQETVRIAAYQYAIDGLAAEQQLYDARGSTAIRLGHDMDALAQRKALAQSALEQEMHKRNVEMFKLQQEQQKIAETERHNRSTEAEAALKRAGKGGAGTLPAVFGGPAADPRYPMWTGFVDPFTSAGHAPEPIMGIRQIGGKGEDPKERNELQQHLAMYKHVNDELTKMKAIADELGGGGKGLAESIWSKRKTTLAAQYDATKEALTSYMTKAIGDRPTQGQLELQAKRIPDRASVFEARDPAKLLQDQLDEADRAFAADVGVMGVNAAPVIAHAQQARAVAQPTPEQQLDDANAALAVNPGDPDALTAQQAASQRLVSQVSEDQQREAAVSAARALPDAPAELPEEHGRPAPEAAAVKAANRETGHYAALLQRFRSEYVDMSYRRGLKPGEIAAADREQRRKLGDLAQEVIGAQRRADELRTKAHQEIGRNTLLERAQAAGIDRDEALARARVGIDPVTGGPLRPPPPPEPTQEPAAQPPYNPLVPDRSFAPGADPTEPMFTPVPGRR